MQHCQSHYIQMANPTDIRIRIMDKELIERVAIAISPWRSGKDRRMRYHDFSWEKLMPNVQDAYREQAKAAIEAYRSYLSPSQITQGLSNKHSETDLNKCPGCGGPADNGHDRCLPPSPYFCTKCDIATRHPSYNVGLHDNGRSLTEFVRTGNPTQTLEMKND